MPVQEPDLERKFQAKFPKINDKKQRFERKKRTANVDVLETFVVSISI
jgi:hypothetical protein